MHECKFSRKSSVMMCERPVRPSSRMLYFSVDNRSFHIKAAWTWRRKPLWIAPDRPSSKAKAVQHDKRREWKTECVSHAYCSSLSLSPTLHDSSLPVSLLNNGSLSLRSWWRRFIRPAYAHSVSSFINNTCRLVLNTGGNISVWIHSCAPDRNHKVWRNKLHQRENQQSQHLPAFCS